MPRLIREALQTAKVTGQERVSTGVDVIGSIAIVRLSGFSQSEKKKVGNALLKRLANVEGVFEQVGRVEGELRLRKLRHLAGRESTLTVHRENGCAFKVDVAKCYFSPRLSTERLRIAKLVKKDEKVLNMFAGVGPFSIPAAKASGASVTSCEINPLACELHEENNRINKVEKLVRVLNLDAAELPRTERSKFDRIVMPHPSQSDKFVPVALALAKPRSTIHYYRHVHGEGEGEATGKLKEELAGLLLRRSSKVIRRVRLVGPGWIEMVADIRLRP